MAMGWNWDLQDPQMPHTNNLELAVFPEILKSHSALLKSYSNTMASADEIWQVCESVWRELDSALID